MSTTSNALFARGVLTSGLAMGMMGLVNYFSRRTLALGLNAEDFAFFYGCFALVSLFGSILDFGSGSALNILFPKYQVRRKKAAMRAYCSSVLGVRLLSACAVSGVLFALAHVLSVHVYHYPAGIAVLCWTLVMLPFFVAFGFLVDLCFALQEFTLRSWLMVIQPSLVLVGILILLHPLGRLSAPISFILSFIVAIPAGTAILIRKHPFLHPLPVLSHPLTKRLWTLSRWFFLVSLGTALFNNLDILILAKFSSLHNLALYNVALPVMQIFQCLLVVPAVFIPIAARLWQRGCDKELQGLYVGVQAFLFAACGACVVLTAVSGDRLLGLLFKHEYAAAAPSLALLTSGVFFACMTQMNFSLLGTIDKPGKIAVAVCAGAAVDIAGSFAGALLFGTAGVAAARTLGMAVMFAVSQYHLSRLSTLKFSWKFGILSSAATGLLWFFATTRCLPYVQPVRLGLFLVLFLVSVSPLLPSVWGLMKGLAGSREEFI